MGWARGEASLRHPPLTPLNETQRKLVEDNYKLVFAGCKKYRRGDIDRELMEAEFGYALCQAALTYQASKGSFSGWVFWYFYQAFMVLIRDKYKRGIATTRNDVRTHNVAVYKRRTCESETSIESMQESGKIQDRSCRIPVNEEVIKEMRDDYQILKQRLTGIRLDIIESRMAGESFKSIGARHKLSKQRIHMLTVEAIEQMQRSMVG